MYILGTTLGSYFKWSILQKKRNGNARQINKSKYFFDKIFYFWHKCMKIYFFLFSTRYTDHHFWSFSCKIYQKLWSFHLLLKAMPKNLQSMRMHCWRKEWSSYINSKDRLKLLILVIENSLIYFLTIYSDCEFTQNIIRFYRSQFCKVLTFNFARKFMK